MMSSESLAIKAPKPSVLSTGLALFAMFFGAGNLIFPLILGRLSGTETPYAILGLGVSAVAFPFLGLVAMMFYAGNIGVFLGRLGKWPAFLLLFILQMSQGPAGSMPRLVTLMHASIKSYFPQISLLSFSLAICFLLFVLTIRPQRVVRLIGGVLTPVFLLTLAILIAVGVINAPAANPVFEGSWHHFALGLKLGYQTTDLIAALLFATVILPHLSQGAESPQQVRQRMLQASLIASALLMATYIGLCWVSAHHSWTFGSLPPEELLQRISQKVLGPFGGVVSALAVFLACLTTAISLAAIFSSYVKNDLFKQRWGTAAALGFTLILTAAFANLGFSGIVKLWGPILDVLYPSLIVLSALNIAHSLYQVQMIRTPVFCAIGIAFFLFKLIS